VGAGHPRTPVPTIHTEQYRFQEKSPPMSNYGSHIQEIVSDTHRAVTNLTEQDAENRARQLTRWHTTDRAALHISELANECRFGG
jgi:hypothetical protein